MTPETRQILANTYPWLGNLQAIANGIVSTLFKKEQHYAGSWQKRGGPGAFMMLARKWDRIESQAQAVNYDIFVAVEKNEADIVDDIDDLIGYLLLVRSKCSGVRTMGMKPEDPGTLYVLDQSGEVAHTISPRTTDHPAPFGYAGEDESLPAPSNNVPKHRPLNQRPIDPENDR